MAVVRTTRSSPPWALIVFVALWAITTVIAVLLYLQLGKAQLIATTASRRIDRIVLPSEMQNPTIQNMLASADARHSVVTKLLADINSLEQITIGRLSHRPVGELTSISGPIATTLQQAGMQGKPLTTAITAMAAQQQAAQARIAHLENRIKREEAAFASANQTFTDNITTIAEKLKRTHQQMAALTTQLTDSQNSLGTQATTFQQKISSNQQKFVRDLELQVVKGQQLTQDLAAEKNMVSDLRSQLAGYKAPSEGAGAILSHAQGLVLSVAPGQNSVYINLGRAEKLPIGLTFAVFNPQLGVGSGISGGGKGAIVVTHVGEYASLCRITHVRHGQSIFTGDLISNPIFQQKGRKFHFFVYGDFAVNGNGVPTAQGGLEIKRLIKKWGGVIDHHLTSQTDFLVLGAEPSTATLPFGTGASTPQGKALLATRAAEQVRYSELTARATSLSVPILNANRFLAMIGYYNTPLTHE